MYKMTFNDGSTLDNLAMRGNSLRRKEEMTPAMFAGKLNPVTITGTSGEGEDDDYGGLTGYHPHMAVIYIRKFDDEYGVAFRDIPQDEYERNKNAADIQYVAMMNGIDLED